MDPLRLSLTEASSNRFAQVLYRCLEEVGSTKGVFYLRREDGSFFHVCHYGWPRGSAPPDTIPAQDGLLILAQREKRSFAANELRDFPELAPFGEGGESPRFLVTPLYDAGEWIGLLLQRHRIRNQPFDVARDERPTLRIGEELVAMVRELTHPVPLPSGPSSPESTAAGLRATAPTETAGTPEAGGPFPPQEVAGGAPSVGLIPDLPEEAAPQASQPPGQEPTEGFRSGARPGEAFGVLPWEQEKASPVHRLETPRPPEGPQPVGTRKPGKIPPELRAFWWDAAAILHDLVPFDAAVLWMDEADELRPVLGWSPGILSPALKQQILGHLTFLVPGLDQKQLHLVSRSAGKDPVPMDGVFQAQTHLLLGEEGGGKDLLLLFRLAESPFTGKETVKTGKLGRLVTAQLHEHRIHERYHRAFLSVSHRILRAGEGRHPQLRAHSLGAAKLARGLGLWMNLPTLEVEALTIAAILHDVGQLLLDPALLARPDPSAEELAKIRTHPVLAGTFLKDFAFPFEVLKVIRHHHERWDGTGYPDGIGGTAIPLASRIIFVVDAYQAMTSGAADRHPLTSAQAVDELRRNAGTQFDPDVVDQFCAMIRRPEPDEG